MKFYFLVWCWQCFGSAWIRILIQQFTSVRFLTGYRELEQSDPDPDLNQPLSSNLGLFFFCFLVGWKMVQKRIKEGTRAFVWKVGARFISISLVLDPDPNKGKRMRTLESNFIADRYWIRNTVLNFWQDFTSPVDGEEGRKRRRGRLRSTWSVPTSPQNATTWARPRGGGNRWVGYGAVLGNRDILMRILIRTVPLTNGSGSNSFLQWFLRYKKIYFSFLFFSHNLPAGTLSSVFNLLL